MANCNIHFEWCPQLTSFLQAFFKLSLSLSAAKVRGTHPTADTLFVPNQSPSGVATNNDSIPGFRCPIFSCIGNCWQPQTGKYEPFDILDTDWPLLDPKHYARERLPSPATYGGLPKPVGYVSSNPSVLIRLPPVQIGPSPSG
jgi:hypothetical protein